LKKIPKKRDFRIRRTASGSSTLTFSLPFIAIGVWFLLAFFGALPVPVMDHGPISNFGLLYGGSIFGAVGFFTFYRAVSSIIIRRRAKKVLERYFDKPWLADHPWRREGVEDSASSRWKKTAMFSIFWFVMLYPFYKFIFIPAGGISFLLVKLTIFISVGFIITGIALYQYAQYKKFGVGRIAFLDFPFFIGNKVRVLFYNEKVPRCEATLRYVMEKMEINSNIPGSSRGGASPVCYEIYSEKKTFNRVSLGMGAEMIFDLPEDKTMVNQLIANPIGKPLIKYWELLIESKMPGIDYKTTFLIPVYGKKTL